MNELLKKLMQKYKNLGISNPNLPVKTLQDDVTKEVKLAIVTHKIKGVDIKRATSFLSKVKKKKTVKEVVSEIGEFFLTP